MIEYQKQGTVHVFSAKDVFTERDIHDARKQISQCAVTGIPKVVMDLSQVPLLSSEVLEMLLDFRDLCAKRGGTFKLCGMNTLMVDVLRVTGITETIELLDDELQAVRSFVQ